MQPSITDWISSVASLVGGLAGIGALVVAILSYLKSTRALAADRDTIESVGATISALEAFAAAAGDDPESPVRTQGAAYAAALQDAQDKLATAKGKAYSITCPHCRRRLGPFTSVTSGIVKCGHCGKVFNVRV